MEMEVLNKPLITDWLMVGITAAYVIFTIAIFVSNMMSVCATKRQFAETQRLSVLPFLSVSLSKITLTENVFHLSDIEIRIGEITNADALAWVRTGITIKNTGSGLISNLRINVGADAKVEKNTLESTLICQDNEITIDVSIFGEHQEKKQSKTALFIFFYSDVLGNNYKQILEMNLSILPYSRQISIESFKIKEPNYIESNNVSV